VIRAVLAVAIAVALLATTTPALSDAREDATRTEMDRIATHVERTGTDLASSSTAVAEAELAPRSVLRVRIPTGFARRAIEGATIGCRADVGSERGPKRDAAEGGEGCELVLAWRTEESGVETHRIRGVTLAPERSPIELSADGTWLRLEHRGRGEGDAVELRAIRPPEQGEGRIEV
jgi:hypothetical protein